jgi:hypothetical protein
MIWYGLSRIIGMLRWTLDWSVSVSRHVILNTLLLRNVWRAGSVWSPRPRIVQFLFIYSLWMMALFNGVSMLFFGVRPQSQSMPLPLAYRIMRIVYKP